ncbi:TolC family protein [Aquimarina intermedia]|uniref:Outer membrane protein TolC n=1 Tax=Aquimarina intermedia TaxID=350814 RepID=A0A5S5CCP3_9FLAO|nr:TolC family protein [Aquimarina intermedia]TYP76106.1 outer membrane protein TolC [Aquimarina intermedia]
MKNYNVILYLLLLVALPTVAQEPQSGTAVYSFTLEEAIDFALENNYKAINARRDVARAIKKKWETTAQGLPQIDGSVDYQNQLKQPVTLLPNSAFDNRQSTINTVEQYFDNVNRNGEQVQPLEGFTPVIFGTKQQMNLTATLSQLIFDGSYLVGLQAAKTFLEYTDNLEEKTQLEVRKSIINSYGAVLLANESVRILENNKETLETNLNETKKIFENGLTEEENVEQLQITFLQISNQLSNTKRLADIALQMFNLSLGVDVTSNTVLTDNLEQLALNDMDLAIAEQPFIPENTIDYKIGYNLTQQRGLELKLEKSRALPSISAFVNYGTAAFDNEFVFFDSDTRWFQSSILGAGIKIPIFSSLKRSAKTQQARIALDQANTQFIETQQNIQLNYNRAMSEYLYAIETYQTSKQNLALAERIENKNQIKYTEGLSTSFDLRQAQLQLYTSQQEALQSMLDIINAKATLETILNTPEK